MLVTCCSGCREHSGMLSERCVVSSLKGLLERNASRCSFRHETWAVTQPVQTDESIRAEESVHSDVLETENSWNVSGADCLECSFSRCVIIITMVISHHHSFFLFHHIERVWSCFENSQLVLCLFPVSIMFYRSDPDTNDPITSLTRPRQTASVTTYSLLQTRYGSISQPLTPAFGPGHLPGQGLKDKVQKTWHTFSSVCIMVWIWR